MSFEEQFSEAIMALSEEERQQVALAVASCRILLVTGNYTFDLLSKDRFIQAGWPEANILIVEGVEKFREPDEGDKILGLFETMPDLFRYFAVDEGIEAQRNRIEPFLPAVLFAGCSTFPGKYIAGKSLKTAEETAQDILLFKRWLEARSGMHLKIIAVLSPENELENRLEVEGLVVVNTKAWSSDLLRAMIKTAV